MTGLVNVLLLTAAAAGVSALPSKVGNVVGGRATIPQVPNPNYKFVGALSIYKTYLKFKAPVPEYLKEAVERLTGMSLDKRSEGSVGATPIDTFDDAYVSQVSIGTPAQVLNLDFDTGSSDFWVFSSETPSSEVSGQAIYSPNASSSSKVMSGYTWSISYGDGSSSSGNVYQDKVTIGGVSTTQAVECAQQVSSSFTSESKIDGLVGLGFDSLNTVTPSAQPTFFDNVKSSLESPVFTADLKYEAPGTYDFGFINSTKYKGSITYTSVSTNPGYWEWTSTGYAVGSGSFTSTSIDGIADTGTTLLYLPDSIVSAYYAHVSGSSNNSTYGGYVFSCSTTLPTFTFGVGSARITIPGKYLDYGPVTTGSSTCFGGLQSSSGIGINIFGDVALKSAFVVFNGGSSPTLGWASKST